MRSSKKIYFLFLFLSLFSNSKSQTILGLDLNTDPKKLTGYDLQVFLMIEEKVLKEKGRGGGKLPMFVDKRKIDPTVLNNLSSFDFTSLMVFYPFGLIKVEDNIKADYFNEMRPLEFWFQTEYATNIALGKVFKTFYAVKKQLVVDLGPPSYEETNKEMIFLRWDNIAYQIILYFSKIPEDVNVRLTYFKK